MEGGVGSGGCERRIEVFVKIQKKKEGGRVGSGGVGRGGGGGLVGSNVGVGGDVGYGDMNQIKGIVQCIKRYCTILRKFKKCGGEGEGQYLNPKHSQCI